MTVWTPLVEGIRANDPASLEELYRIMTSTAGWRAHFVRHLGWQDADDQLHELFMAVVSTVQRGELRDPECLMGFTRTVCHRIVAAAIDAKVKGRAREASLEKLQPRDLHTDPEEQAIAHQTEQITARVLESMATREREVLTRYYLTGDSAETICADMELTPTIYRLLKSRAKARYGELCRSALKIAA